MATRAKVQSPYEWHRKPKGYRGPCPVCGCDAPRLRAEHRAKAFNDIFRGLGGELYAFEKVVSVCFGLDWNVRPVAVRGATVEMRWDGTLKVTD